MNIQMVSEFNMAAIWPRFRWQTIYWSGKNSPNTFLNLLIIIYEGRRHNDLHLIKYADSGLVFGLEVKNANQKNYFSFLERIPEFV
jgi:hypothetical protein